jgi:hypothetical protein
MFSINLPSGKQVVMKMLTFMDRQRAVRLFKSDKEQGFMLDELLAAMALISIDGKDLTLDLLSDPIDHMSDWELPDVQYYLEVFMTINSLDDKARKAAEEQAKKLMGAGSQKVAKATK